MFKPLFVNPDGYVLYGGSNIIIYMPDTSISTIEWEEADFFYYNSTSTSKFYLKLMTENKGTRYFVGNSSSLEKSCGIDYEDSLRAERLGLLVFIRCKELCNFVINTRHLQMTISFVSDNNFSFSHAKAGHARYS